MPNPKVPSQFGGVLLASVPAHTSPRTRATTHTLHSGVHRSLGALLRAGAFGLASSLHWLPFSRGVTCAFGVLSCRAFLFVTRDGAGARRMFQGVDVDVSSAIGGWRRSTQASRCTSGAAATLPRVGVGPAAPRDLHRNRGHHACRGRCYTRPCARAKGPSSFSAVRRQDWLNRTTTRQSPRGE